MTKVNGHTKNRGEWAEVVAVMGIVAQGFVKTVSFVDGKLRETDAEVTVARASIVRNKVAIEYRIYRNKDGEPVEVEVATPHETFVVSMAEFRGDYQTLKEAVVKTVDNANNRRGRVHHAKIPLRLG